MLLSLLNSLIFRTSYQSFNFIPKLSEHNFLEIERKLAKRCVYQKFPNMFHSTDFVKIWLRSFQITPPKTSTLYYFNFKKRVSCMKNISNFVVPKFLEILIHSPCYSCFSFLCILGFSSLQLKGLIFHQLRNFKCRLFQ